VSARCFQVNEHMMTRRRDSRKLSISARVSRFSVSTGKRSTGACAYVIKSYCEWRVH